MNSKECGAPKVKLICVCGAHLVICPVTDDLHCPNCGCPIDLEDQSEK